MRFLKNSIPLYSLLLVTVVILSLSVSCEPTARFQIRNDTDQVLDIFIARTYSEHVEAGDVRVEEGSVGPGRILQPKNVPGSYLTYLIEARDMTGNIVYSKEFTAEALMKAKWRVVISTSQ